MDDSLELIADPTRGEAIKAVHETRKNCKKGRGLIRLVRPVLGDEYREANVRFRDAGRALSPIRAPHALLETFDDLIASASDQLPHGGVLGVRQHLAEQSSQATEAIVSSERDRLEETRSQFEGVRDRVTGWRIPDSFESMTNGIAKTYKRGRKRHAEALEAPTGGNFHEWRKRVKYLWYQVRLLRDSAPSILRPLARRLHDLSDALGDAHDLAMLRGQMREWERDDISDELDAVDVLARGRKAELEERALSLGMRIYTETPEAFTNRMEGYWDAWHEMAPAKAGELAELYPPDDGLAQTSLEDLRNMARNAGVDGRSSMDRAELERSVRAAGF